MTIRSDTQIYLENVLIYAILTDLCFEGHKFKDHFYSEEHSEDDVQHVRQVGHMVGLVAVLWEETQSLFDLETSGL